MFVRKKDTFVDENGIRQALDPKNALLFEYQPRRFTPEFVKRYIEKEWGVNTPFNRHRFLIRIFYKQVCVGLMRIQIAKIIESLREFFEETEG